MRIHAKYNTDSKSNAVLGNVNRFAFEMGRGEVFILELSCHDGHAVSCQMGWTIPDQNAVVFDSEEMELEECRKCEFVKILSDFLDKGFNVFDFPMISIENAGRLSSLFQKIINSSRQFQTSIFRMREDYLQFKKGNYYTGFVTNVNGMVSLDIPNGGAEYVPGTMIDG